MSMNTVIIDNSTSSRGSSSSSFMTATMEQEEPLGTTPPSPDVEEPFYIPSAELYNEPQVYDAVVIDQDCTDDAVLRDPKAILHFRLVQLAIVLLSLTGITLVVLSLGIQKINNGRVDVEFSSNQRNRTLLTGRIVHRNGNRLVAGTKSTTTAEAGQRARAPGRRLGHVRAACWRAGRSRKRQGNPVRMTIRPGSPGTSR